MPANSRSFSPARAAELVVKSRSWGTFLPAVVKGFELLVYKKRNTAEVLALGALAYGGLVEAYVSSRATVSLDGGKPDQIMECIGNARTKSQGYRTADNTRTLTILDGLYKQLNAPNLAKDGGRATQWRPPPMKLPTGSLENWTAFGGLLSTFPNLTELHITTGTSTEGIRGPRSLGAILQFCPKLTKLAADFANDLRAPHESDFDILNQGYMQFFKLLTRAELKDPESPELILALFEFYGHPEPGSWLPDWKTATGAIVGGAAAAVIASANLSQNEFDMQTEDQKVLLTGLAGAAVVPIAKAAYKTTRPASPVSAIWRLKINTKTTLDRLKDARFDFKKNGTAALVNARAKLQPTTPPPSPPTPDPGRKKEAQPSSAKRRSRSPSRKKKK